MDFPSISALRRMRGLVPDIGCFEASGKIRQAGSGLQRMPPEELQESQEFFGDPTKWWDNRRITRSSGCRHKISKLPLSLDNWQTQIVKWDSPVKVHLESVSPSVQGQGASEEQGGPLQIGMCRKLREDGQIADAVGELSLLVQRGCHVDQNVYYHVLKRCIAHKDLVTGRRIHALTTESGYEGDAFLATQLIGLYASSGRLNEAMQVFNQVCTASANNWATIIFAYVRHGEAAQAILLYQQMLQATSVKPSNRVYVAVLKACAIAGDLVAGKEVHAHILSSTGKPDIFVQTALVSMYAKCGNLGEARRVFEALPERDVVAWTTMLAGYAQQGMGEEALSLYTSMQREGVTPPNPVTFVCLLQACASVGVGALDQGKQLHSQIQERLLQEDSVLGGCLVNMYAKCGSLRDARQVFDKLPERGVVAWTAMFAGYAQQGMGQEALNLYSIMQQEGLITPDAVTYVCLLQSCASVGVGALDEGKRLHSQIQERGLQEDLVCGGSLVNMYAKCGSLGNARQVFDRLPEKDVVAWTAMLAGYAQQGMGQEALSLYSSMCHEGKTTPDPVTYVSLLQACASVGVGALDQGKLFHSEIKERGMQVDFVLGGSLVNMYANCGSLEDARKVFDSLPEKAWNSMLAGYAQQGMGEESLSLYSSMQRHALATPDSVTYVCLLQACASVGVGALGQGRQLHSEIRERGLQGDLIVGRTLVNMYAKCGSLGEARQVFDCLSERDVVAWTAMLAGYVQQGMGEEALTLYTGMQREGFTPPDSVTFLCLLQACASAGALEQGKQLHSRIKEHGLQTDVFVGAALVNMYAKCGSIYDSQQIFDSLPERTIEAWGALIGGYSRQGDSEAVFDLLDRMRREGLQPDGITFLGVLTVCSHVGEVEKARQHFEAMRLDYGLSPTIEHYTCMVDLLGRAGHLDEALQVAKSTPFPPTSTVWHTLLGACRKWNNVEVGLKAFELAVSLDGEDASSAYVLMSDIYASARMWEDAGKEEDIRCLDGARPGLVDWT